MEALQHKLGTIKTQSMVKDGQIEQLEVRDVYPCISAAPWPVLVAPAPYLPCMTSGLSTFLIAVQVSLDESKIECQRLNVCCTQRESDVVTAENSKVSLMSTLDCQNVHSSNNSCKKVCYSRRQMHWSSACCMSSMQRGSPQSCKH